MNWEQFKALLWLRSRLWRNRWRRTSEWSRALGLFLTVLAVVAICAVFVGGLFGGWFGLSGADPMVHLILWDVGAGIFIMFWLIGLMTELRPPMADFARWHYHRDPTHVGFHSEASLRWIAARFGWQVESAGRRVILLRRP